jgi:DNA-binding response OmpR family regulator
MLNVLIVEDDLTIADMVQEALEADGYGVIGIARTFEEAIKAAERHQPDFAIIDVQLANGDLGTEVGAYLRQTSQIGIIISTGNDHIDFSTVLADAVMTKPYRLRDLGRGLKIIGEIAQFGHTQFAFPRNFQLLSRPSA